MGKPTYYNQKDRDQFQEGWFGRAGAEMNAQAKDGSLTLMGIHKKQADALDAQAARSTMPEGKTPGAPSTMPPRRTLLSRATGQPATAAPTDPTIPGPANSAGSETSVPPTYFGQPRRTLLSTGPLEGLPGRGAQETEAKLKENSSESESDRANWPSRQEEKNDDPGEKSNKKVVGLVGPKIAESLPGHPGGKSPEQSWRDTADGAKQTYETGKTEVMRGRLLSRENELNFQEFMGDGSQELQDQINENQAKLDALSVRPEKEGFIKNLGKNILNWFGDVSDDAMDAAPKAVEGGLAGAAVGSRLPIPHPLVKGISATGAAVVGAAVDGGAHLATDMLKEQIGESYKNIKKITDVDGKPVGKDVARTVSLAIVGVKTALDLGGGRLAKLVPGLDKGLDKIFLKAADKCLKSDKFKALAGKAAKEFGQGAGEVSVGLVQGMNQILMEEVVVAMEKENGKEFTPKTREDVVEVITQQIGTSAQDYFIDIPIKHTSEKITNEIIK